MRVRVQTEPSLALIKYWGKAEGGINLPATTSIAVSLGGLTTTTEAVAAPASSNGPRDTILLDNEAQQDPKIASFLAQFRSRYPQANSLEFTITSSNSFPTAAGIASSSSGFAALALAVSRAAGISLDSSQLSDLARTGSGSAARAVFGGFTSFPAGSPTATRLFDHTHWPQLRILVVMVHSGAKPVGSRDAMERTRLTSPYYEPWVTSSHELVEPTIAAVRNRRLDELGPLMRRSYLSMFGSMLAADPGVVYWLPESVRLIHQAARWRDDGIEVWETMDAGPQVKLITTEDQLPALRQRLQQEFPALSVLEATVGAGPQVTELNGASA
ncbi:diphosphomevalonate decarboxylase [Spirochaeta africana]|uniref:diphosphomevalonate decarboxylase n=1 Tax=Spirochaeta africana (strain ATCC 700263 / DSM 8902 / Z-7692) TaxID=889378 RepID=H9UG36_SPIAZ|nr:diphosphomevalonate decarboxylase [Spirochaeta africana]AFG36479.1 diphosphomevalonate decarboxylase [Spirochaeta africana DSM 8902]